MNRKVYEQAMEELEQLHEHLYLHVADGSDRWTAQVLAMFRRAVGEQPVGNDIPDDEVVYLTAEPPQPVS